MDRVMDVAEDVVRGADALLQLVEQVEATRAHPAAAQVAVAERGAVGHHHVGARGDELPLAAAREELGEADGAELGRRAGGGLSTSGSFVMEGGSTTAGNGT